MSNDRLVIRSYPKAITLLPTALLALIFGIVELFPGAFNAVGRALGLFFMFIFFFNILVIAFDFTEAKTYGFIGLIIILILAYIVLAQAEIIPADVGSGLIKSLDIRLTAQAYLGLALSIFFMMLIAWLSTRWKYWIVESNQITKKEGLFGRVERFSTAGVRYDIRIDDVFEYIIFKAGSIVFYFPTKKIAEKIPMVLNVRKVERRLAEILGRVEVETEEETEVTEMGAE